MNIRNIPVVVLGRPMVVKLTRRARIRAWLRRWWLRFLLVDRRWQEEERWELDDSLED